MRLVLDTSAAIEVAIQRRHAARFSAPLAEADTVLAPDLLVPEVVNTVWKYHQFENLSLPECDRIIEASLGLVDVFVPSLGVSAEAFLLARTCRRPAYDMFFLALARREDAALLTADTGLRREAERQGIRVA